jgi:uncharacterized delta-60 repeat protein
MMKKFFRRSFTISQVVLLVLLSFLTVQAAGEVDPTFSPALIKTDPTGRASLTAVQPDGKIIVHGIYSQITTTSAVGGAPLTTNVFRLNVDGSLDTSFNAPSLNNFPISVAEIALQSTGKIIIVGSFSLAGNILVNGIVRLNTDGSFDSTFSPPSMGNSIPDVEILADDKLIVAGSGIFARLLPDGPFDPTFTTSSNSYWKLGMQPDGKILTATVGGALTRRNADGSSDPTFTSSVFNGFQSIWDIRVQADGKILVGGQFNSLNGFPVSKIARLNADGTGDLTFNSPFGTPGTLFKVIPLPDGRILVGGRGLSFNNQPLRLNSDGSIDSSFSSPILISAYDLDRMADGQIVVAGQRAFTDSTNVKPVYRLSADGVPDNTFQINFGVNAEGKKIFVQSDGKILVGGNFEFASNFGRPAIARFNADGSVDTGFNLAFAYEPQITYTAIDVQPDGKIIIGDSSSSTDALRLNPNGSSDIVFQQTRGVNDIKVLSSGKILFAGSTAGGSYVKLFNNDGTLDPSFNVTGNNAVLKLAVQTDGKIVIVGSFTQVNSVNRGRIARLNADGTLDNTFDTSTGANNTISDFAIQADGKILIAGSFAGYNLTNRPFIARLDTNSSLDIGFLPNPNNSIESIKIQPNNKILIGGIFSSVNNTPREKLARLNPDGTLDLTLNPGTGANDWVRDVECQSNGKILVTGAFSAFGGFRRFGLVRLENSFINRTAFDYDGDGKADVSVFRPSTNRWYIFKSSDSTVSETTFGIAGDVPVPADFDGDGKTDIAIFRPSSGDWWSLSSINGAQIFAHWGANGDIPRPSDFDGDGRADYIVFRPSDNFWYRISSGNGASSNGAFGLAGDKPVTGDFDGDGKSDKAIFRPSSGDWWYQSSINGAQLAVHWGISTDIPAPADFDGDGKTDFAVYRPSTGVWYVINSSNGSFTIMNFGIAEDKPVPADYDGDGKADIAVFRPSTGVWYLQRTTAGFLAQQFGISTDVPTENAFVP